MASWSSPKCFPVGHHTLIIAVLPYFRTKCKVLFQVLRRVFLNLVHILNVSHLTATSEKTENRTEPNRDFGEGDEAGNIFEGCDVFSKKKKKTETKVENGQCTNSMTLSD